MSIPGRDGGGVPVPGDKQEGDTRTDPRRVVEGDAMSGPRRVVNRWSDEDRRKVACVHLHGPGAREMSTPVRRTKTGPGGKQTSRLTKKKWFKCDVGMKGSNLRQTTLSFGAVLDASRTGRRDNKGSLGQK